MTMVVWNDSFLNRLSQDTHFDLDRDISKVLKICLRWPERVFNCLNPFKTMKDYKKLFVTM